MCGGDGGGSAMLERNHFAGLGSRRRRFVRSLFLQFTIMKYEEHTSRDNSFLISFELNLIAFIFLCTLSTATESTIFDDADDTVRERHIETQIIRIRLRANEKQKNEYIYLYKINNYVRRDTNTNASNGRNISKMKRHIRDRDVSISHTPHTKSNIRSRRPVCGTMALTIFFFFPQWVFRG